MTHTIDEILGLPVFAYDEISSTNDTARELFDEGNANEGAVVVTQFQTKGRGQGDSKWESNKGENLLMSVILEPRFLQAHNQIYMNMAISLSLFETIQSEVSENVSIKWPNDIYIGNKKASGILIENILNNHNLRACIIGIGLNINQLAFETKNAVSLRMTDARMRDPEAVMKRLLHNLSRNYTILRTNGYAQLMQEYISNMLLLNKESTFLKNGEAFRGTVKGLDINGRLILSVQDDLQYFHNKEIEWVI